VKASEISRRAAFTSLGAALYAIGAYATAYIESPWGMGQFRPAVIIPSIFAILFGPWVGGVSGAVGTLIADSVKHGTLYIPSLIAAVPANFLAFYLLGALLRGRFRWPRFIAASVLSLAVGNVLCAVLYTSYKSLIGALPPQLVPGLITGLSLWWFATMVPFQLLALPPVLKAIVSALPSLAPLDVREECVSGSTPKREMFATLCLTGALMIIVGLAVLLSQSVASFFVGALSPGLREMVKSLVAAMFSATGVMLIVASAFVAILK